jgi:hypothetical protein
MNQSNGYNTLRGLSTCEAARDQPVGCYVNCQHACAAANRHSKFCSAVYIPEFNDSFSCVSLDSEEKHYLKGQCHEIFILRFFVNLLLLVPEDMTRNDFFRIFEELLDYLGASLVSLTPAKSRVLLQLSDSFQY